MVKDMNNKRVFEIDLLRFIAIILMIVFHFAYDLNTYGNFNVDYSSIGLRSIGEISGFLFIFVSGISSGYSKHTTQRGFKIFGFGMAITIITYIVIGYQYVRFGVLHLLGVAILLYPFISFLQPLQLLLAAIGSYVLGFVFKGVVTSTFLLLPLGIYYNGFESVDYYPIFPYISYFILGIFAYKTFYKKGKRMIKKEIQISFITKASNYSLWIYLIHQPVLIGGLLFFKNFLR